MTTSAPAAPPLNLYYVSDDGATAFVYVPMNGDPDSPIGDLYYINGEGRVHTILLPMEMEPPFDRMSFHSMPFVKNDEITVFIPSAGHNDGGTISVKDRRNITYIITAYELQAEPYAGSLPRVKFPEAEVCGVS